MIFKQLHDRSAGHPDGLYQPGVGIVPWTDASLYRRAHYLTGTHQPDRALFTVDWPRKFLPLVRLNRQFCTACGQRWMCPEVRWATDYLSSLNRAWSASLHVGPKQPW